MKFAWYHYTFLSELYYIKLAIDFFIPIECGVWSVIRDDGTDVDAVNIVHVLITQEAADQEQTDPDIHDQELLRKPPEENIVWLKLFVCLRMFEGQLSKFLPAQLWSDLEAEESDVRLPSAPAHSDLKMENINHCITSITTTSASAF